MRSSGSLRVVMVFLLLFSIASCGSGGQDPPGQSEPEVLHIAAAANLSYVMPELVAGFRKEYAGYAEMDIRVTKASSGSLTAQIRNSAPYGLFLAANTGYPDALDADGLSDGPPVVYAEGIPVLVYRQGLDCAAVPRCLADSSVKTIAIAHPELAPYGEAAVGILKKEGLFEAVEGKFVYGTSITQTFQHVVTAADAGFIAKSLLYGESGRELEKAGRRWRECSPDSYDRRGLRQSMVLLKGASPAARAFFDYMRGSTARAILEKNGYTVE